MGSKAMSHDSVFVSDSQSSEPNDDGLASSQDNIPGKVKSLQLQLKQAIRMGSPPSLICVKKGEDGGTVSEDDGLPCSPPEISTLHTVLTGSSHESSNLVQRTSSLSLEGSDSEDEQMSLEASSRPASPLVSLPLDFSEPANLAGCLNNSAARHRIAVKQRACAKRKPASREMFESSKVKILSGRVPLRVTEEPQCAVITEPSAEEENKDVVMSETDARVDGGDQQENEADVSLSVQSASERMEEEPAAPDEPAEAEDEDLSSSSSETELDGEKSLPAVDLALDLQGSPGSQAPPGGHHTDMALDSEEEVSAEEPGLLQEVLSSLECPLTSAFVLKPDTRDLQISEDLGGHSHTDGPLDHLTDRPSSSPALNQEEDEEEEGDIPPGIDTRCDLDARDEQLAEEEGHMESDEGEGEEDEVVSPAEDLLEKEPDLPAGGGEETEAQGKAEEVMEQEEVMEEEELKAEVEEVEEEEEVMEEAVVDEVEEEQAVMEEDKEAIEEYEVVTETVVMQQQEEVEEVVMQQKEEDDEEEEEVEVEEVKEEIEGIEVGVEITPDALQQKALAETEEEEEEDDKEDVAVAPEVHEPEHPEETKEVEPDQDSGEEDAWAQSDTGSYSHTGSMERSEFTIERFSAEVKDDASPPQPPEADSEQSPAFSPSSEEPSTPVDKPSPTADINVAGDAEELSSGSNVEEDPGNVLDVPEPSKVRFTIAPAWQRSLSSGGTPKEPPFTSPIKPEAFEQTPPETPSLPGKAEPAASPDPPQSAAPISPVRQPPAQDAGSAENPFGVKLRRTPVLLRYSGDGSGDPPATGLPAEPAEPERRPQSGLPSARPALPKKPDLLEDSTAKLRKTPDSALSRGPGEQVTSPSWISVAKQKQKSFQGNPLEETSPDRKSPLEKDEVNLSSSPVTVSCSLEISKPTATEQEGKRVTAHSPPAQAGQDEPPWLALAKKKAKAWREMPQIVQ